MCCNSVCHTHTYIYQRSVYACVADYFRLCKWVSIYRLHRGFAHLLGSTKSLNQLTKQSKITKRMSSNLFLSTHHAYRIVYIHSLDAVKRQTHALWHKSTKLSRFVYLNYFEIQNIYKIVISCIYNVSCLCVMFWCVVRCMFELCWEHLINSVEN